MGVAVAHGSQFSFYLAVFLKKVTPKVGVKFALQGWGSRHTQDAQEKQRK